MPDGSAPVCVAQTSTCSDEWFEGTEIPICLKHAMEITKAVWKHKRRADEEAAATPLSGKARGAVKDEAGVVYYLHLDGQIKIGYTKDLARRLREYPPTVQLLATEPGDFSRERVRLRQFSNQLADRREWFIPCAELWEHIRQLRDTHKSAH